MAIVWLSETNAGSPLTTGSLAIEIIENGFLRLDNPLDYIYRMLSFGEKMLSRGSGGVLL